MLFAGIGCLFYIHQIPALSLGLPEVPQFIDQLKKSLKNLKENP